MAERSVRWKPYSMSILESIPPWYQITVYLPGGKEETADYREETDALKWVQEKHPRVWAWILENDPDVAALIVPLAELPARKKPLELVEWKVIARFPGGEWQEAHISRGIEQYLRWMVYVTPYGEVRERPECPLCGRHGWLEPVRAGRWSCRGCGDTYTIKPRL